MELCQVLSFVDQECIGSRETLSIPEVFAEALLRLQCDASGNIEVSDQTSSAAPGAPERAKLARLRWLLRGYRKALVTGHEDVRHLMQACAEGTCDWVSETVEQWVVSGERVLVLGGSSGMGKSVLAAKLLSHHSPVYGQKPWEGDCWTVDGAFSASHTTIAVVMPDICSLALCTSSL